jgi:hypothetical protein
MTQLTVVVRILENLESRLEEDDAGLARIAIDILRWADAVAQASNPQDD